MDTWRRGSFRSSGFFKRLSFRRHKRLGNQVVVLSQNSNTIGTPGQNDKRELSRDRKGKSDHLTCQSEDNLVTKPQPPPKPPRLYLDSASCPNITDHRDSPSAGRSFPSTACLSNKATQTHPDLFCPSMDWCSLGTTCQYGKPLLDPSDPFFAFSLDLGPSLLEDVLQTLKKQNLFLNPSPSLRCCSWGKQKN